MSGIQGHRSNEISSLNRIKDEYLFFIIEIAEEPISNEHRKTQKHNILCCPPDVQLG